MKHDGMKGWIDLGSDVNWVDYHGLWGQRAETGTWFIVQWTNLVDAGGSVFADTPFEAQVKYLDFRELPRKAFEGALRSAGWWLQYGPPIQLFQDINLVAEGAHAVLPCLVGALVGHGLGAPLETFTGAK